ncbi:unnamed protein product [Anisakis simplex]|uniref:Uncharacterized protein n=1 Tax=Anisakis simplex TaxID=6269 RepID=A0A3P6RUZ8_ANISI|nr:unnamed protein product [Anisakis simplex]
MYLVPLDLLVSPANQGILVQWGYPETQVFQRGVKRLYLDHLDHKEIWDHLDQWVNQVSRVSVVDKVAQDHLVLLARLVCLDLTVCLVCPVYQAKQVLQERRVSALNIALSMVEYSLRMELVVSDLQMGCQNHGNDSSRIKIVDVDVE